MQTIRSVVLELQPESVPQLRGQLDALKASQEDLPHAYSAIKQALPTLHFMSVIIFDDDQYDPVLVIEVNFDGPPEPFWLAFQAALGEAFRAILRCGRVPRDESAALFRAVTAPGSTEPVAPLLAALALMPAVAHQGNRGLDRARIEAEGQLFATVQDLIDHGGLPPNASAVQIHTSIRAALPGHKALADMPPRIPADESRADWVKLTVFVVVLLAVLVAPGILLSWLVGPWVAALLLVGAGGVFLSRLGLASAVPAWPRRVALTAGAVLLGVLGLAVLCAMPGTLPLWRARAGLGVVGLVPMVAGIVWWIRALEMRDAPQDAPRPDPAMLRAMARREDFITQNHMGSVVHLRPGVLRAILVRVAMRVLGLVLRVQARTGYLGSMRTIHFAHWAFISNGSRLMFFSNFDGSWESYLDDFIEKAHGGLTLAWTGAVGFPTTRFLVLDGATQGRKFKAWARHSMAESLFWYSAYIGFTVNQIERQARVAEGLRRPLLSEQEALAWTLDL